jgi:GNAT superfamily N-acetyltransferase
MKIYKPGEKMDKKELRAYAKIAGEAYADDPVHCYATKNRERRKRFVYHFMMERLSTSNGEDYIYVDEENGAMCVWRYARNEYTVLDFLRCPDWLYLYWFWPNTLRTLAAYRPLDVRAFDENTWIISPVFVDPAPPGKGIATELIRPGIADLTKQGLSCGLEAQDARNVRFYEKLGFRTIREDRFEKGNITHTYMVYQDGKNTGGNT